MYLKKLFTFSGFFLFDAIFEAMFYLFYIFVSFVAFSFD